MSQCSGQSLRADDEERTDIFGSQANYKPYIHYTNAPYESNPLKNIITEHWEKISAILLVLFIIFFFFKSSNSTPLITTNQTLQPSVTALQLTNQPLPNNNIPKLAEPSLKKASSQLPTPSSPSDQPYKSNQPRKVSMDGDSYLKAHKSQEQTIKELQTKIQLHKDRNALFQTKSKFASLEYLRYARYNMQNVALEDEQLMNAQLREEEEMLEKKYRINSYTEQISICMLVYDNNQLMKEFAQQYVLNSIYNQKYSNFIVVYVADGHPEQKVQDIKRFIKQKDKKNKTVLLWNLEKKSFLESVYTAIKNQCEGKKVTAIIEQNDQLLGRQTFKLLNAAYREKNANLVYSNFIEFHSNERQIKPGFAMDYEETTKKQNKYRDEGQKFGSLKSFKTRLLSYVQEKDLKDPFGNFYIYAGDYALMFPLLELSCGQVAHLAEPNYLYYGYEVDPLYGALQINIGRQIRTKAKYQCFRSANK